MFNLRGYGMSRELEVVQFQRFLPMYRIIADNFYELCSHSKHQADIAMIDEQNIHARITEQIKKLCCGYNVPNHTYGLLYPRSLNIANKKARVYRHSPV
jgi:hypothetical protein